MENEKVKTKKKKTKSKTKLTKYMKGLWLPAIVGSLGMIVESAGQLTLPRIMGLIVDNGVSRTLDGSITTEEGRRYILIRGALMILIAVLSIGGGVLCMKASSDVSQRYAARLRNAMFKKISTFSFKNIDEFSTASLTTRLTNDVTAVQNTIMMLLRMMIRVPSLLIVACIFAFSINARLSSMIFLSLPVIAIIVAVILKVGFPMFKRMQKKVDAINGVVQENLIGIRVVKAFVREDHEKEKFKRRTMS